MAGLRPWLVALVLALLGPAAAGWASPGGAALTPLLEAALLPQLEDRLPTGARLEFLLPEDAPEAAVRVLALEHDLRAGLFAAVLETPEGRHPTLRGRVFAVVDVLVPRRPILPGEVTRAEDFEIRTLPAQSLGRFALTDPALILGQEVRRSLAEGRPVQSQSLREQRVVSRGEKLTLIYTKGALELSAPARALEDAAEGETLRVQNLNSNKTVVGRAMGDGRVQVMQ